MTYGTPTNIDRVRGDDWAITGQLTNNGTAVDLTGATLAAQLRSSADSRTVAGTFTVTVTDEDDGRITLALGGDTTSRLRPGTYVYDIEVTVGGSTVTYGAGSRLTVIGDVTR